MRRFPTLIQFGILLALVAPGLHAIPPPATITVAPPASVPYLQAFNVNVTVSGVFGPGTGVVELVLDGSAYGPSIVLDPNGMATFSIPGAQIPAGALGTILPPLPPGTGHLVGVTYGGAPGHPSNYLPQLFSSNQVPLNITPAVTLLSSANPATVGQLVQFTAPINVGPGVPPTGTVTFFDGGVPFGAPVMVSAGQAVSPGRAFSAGNHNITAAYSGDLNYSSAAGGPLVEIVGVPTPANLTFTLSTSANPSTVGQMLTIVASLAASGGNPTGTVQFFDSATLLGTVAVVNGQAVLNSTALAAGSHALSAKYSGDSLFQPAQASIGQVISPLASTVNLTASAVSVPAGQPVVFTAQVGPAPPAGFAAQTGQVIFQDNGFPVATAPLSAGGATLKLTTLGVGTHTLTAVYTGDSTWGASHGSVTVTITVPALLLINAATNLSTVFAPDETVSMFNVMGLSGDTGATVPLGTSLAGISVNVIDSAGVSRLALLYGVFASTGQVNFVIPSGTAAGAATVTTGTQSASVTIANVAPGVFTANQNGQGVFAGQIVQVHADNSQTVEPSATMSGSVFVPTPINFGPPPDRVFLQLYGTGLRHASSVTVTANGTAVPAMFAAQGMYPGLDQVNLELLRTVPSGPVSIVVTVDGQAANTVSTLIGPASIQ